MEAIVGMEVPQREFEAIRRLEEKLHLPEIRQSPEATGNLLAEEFVEFGSSGTIYDDRNSLIASLAAEKSETPSPPIIARDYAFQSISPDAVLVTYRSIRPAAEDRPARHVLRSSIWRRIDGRWQMIFHQGTPTTPDDRMV
ncbi:nuclear transport factor 2 family protein [Rhizobium sp. A37_96]